MSEPPINANVTEPDGTYYQVQLYVVPRVGELVSLYSYLDQAMKRYEVLQVVHEVRDVSDKIPQSKGGCHYVTLFVKHSRSKFFKPSVNPVSPADLN